MLFLLIVLLSVLTAGVIWALHRNQLRKQVEVVERINDLPPLESTVLPDFTPPSSPVNVAVNTIDKPAPDAGTASRVATDADLPPLSQSPAENMAWQDQVKLLKDQGELDSAVQLCQQHFPKAQAFQQAAVLLRLQIRQRVDQKQPLETEAGKLYRCAVLADLFRSGVQLKPLNARQAMKGLSSVEFQYQQIGHQQLKLLTKGDVKMLEQLWGHPGQHIHAEEALGVLWETLCRS